MGLCENFPELHSFLTKKVDPDSVPMIIPWTSFTKAHVDKLKRVSRKQNVGTIGTYWFHKEPIGGGSFGHVFVGINEKDGREIAIKKIEKLRLVRPEDQREIRNLTALADCQQVVSYIFFDDSDKDFVYTVLELMEGHLDDYFASSWFNVSRSVLLCKDIVEGLSYLHGQKPKPILHRDLKPGNILYKLHPNLCLKIADFGLSSPLTTVGTTVLGTNVGTRCWIAPEVISSSTYQHSPSSDVFSCGLLVHYILSKQKHPFSPADCSNKSREVIDVKTQSNMLSYNMDGWDKFLTPEATHLIKGMLQQDPSHRPCAGDSLSHPLFWTQKKKMDFLCAVGNQYEFECPPASKAASHHKPTAVETDLQNNFSIIVRYAKWDNPNYKDMAKVVAEMKKTIKKVNKKGATYFQKPRTYDTGSVVELVRFIRNANNHVSERSRPPDIKKLILEDFVFLKEFPYLLMEVYKAVTTHGWDPREEIKYAMADQEHQP
ncbi:probable myosin light chain kinase DDB_G0292624 [Exaiptasia diaphana]|uniref:Uncharacterized protein n=1 Tax=Exaiptasia diaphana TaxID=2652724 RepID=A0A913Y3N5_EXADI|nr:probable myosin light chain kinase DDB_G0292624 [Exaiptasia diaphana]